MGLRFFIFIGLFFVLNNVGFTQPANLYVKALEVYLDSLPKYYSNSNYNLDKIYLDGDPIITFDFPNKVLGSEVIILSENTLKTAFKNNNSIICFDRLTPILTSVENKLIIDIKNFGAYYERKLFRKKLITPISGGCKVYFTFDCKLNDYIVSKIEFWGI